MVRVATLGDAEVGIRKAIGILVLTVQVVVGADYYMQTRDAGLHWGELSAADYSRIIQHRYAKAQGAPGSLAVSDLADPAQPPIQAAEADLAEEAQICVRRGTAMSCQ